MYSFFFIDKERDLISSIKGKQQLNWVGVGVGVGVGVDVGVER